MNKKVKIIISIVATAAILFAVIFGVVQCTKQSEHDHGEGTTPSETTGISPATETNGAFSESSSETDGVDPGTDSGTSTEPVTGPAGADTNKETREDTGAETETDTEKNTETTPYTPETDPVTTPSGQNTEPVSTDTETSSVISHTHSYTSKITKEATCGADGVRTYTCSGCGESYTEKIAATGKHNYVSKITKEATCEENGIKTLTCSVCGKSYTETISAIGHKWSDWKVTKEATEDENGVKERSCTVCGKSETEGIKATGTEWDYYIREGWSEANGSHYYILCYDDGIFGDPLLDERTICIIFDYRETWGDKPTLTRIGQKVGKAIWKNKTGATQEKILDCTNLVQISLYLYEDGTSEVKWVSGFSPDD